MNNNNITDVEDIYLQDRIYHDGDTTTYLQFNLAQHWRVVTGGSTRLTVNNSQITSTVPVHATSFHGDGSALTNLNVSAPAIWFPSSWTSPNASYTSSTTWTKPAAVTDAHTVWFYMIGGGGGGGSPSEGREDGGGGGNAVLVCASGASLPSSVTLAIGSGGSAGSSGGATSITVNGVAFSATGGSRGSNNRSSGTERDGANGTSLGKNFTAAYSTGGIGVAYDFDISGYFGAGGGRKNSSGAAGQAGGFLGGTGGTRWNSGSAPGGGGGAEASGAAGAIYIFWGTA
jgi:hypothetical protein